MEDITNNQTQIDFSNTIQFSDEESIKSYEKMLNRARRTAFIARFIILRESKRTKAHRVIEKMSWNDDTTAEELAMMFRQVFIKNGDNLERVDKDIRRALGHAAKRPLNFFVSEYSDRGTLNFVDALIDYEKSVKLLFGEDENPKTGGWRLPSDIK
ncbi:MAG: hypothetical protein ACOX3T_08560 [Bdellovibrionota bacterium]